MDRKTLAHQLERWITEGHFFFEETGRYESNRPLLKSYLVEANAPEVEDRADAVASFFERIGLPVEVQVFPSDDPSIHRVVIGRSNSPATFFLDTLDHRYWIFHTVESASDADQAIRRLVHQTRFLDACWFPSHQLGKWSGEVGTPRSLTAKFAVPSLLYRETITDEDLLKDSLYLRIGSRGDARTRWDQITESGSILAPQMALWSTKVVRHLDDGASTITSDVTASGKMTSKGTSFRLHQEILAGLRSRYRDMIDAWEQTYRIGWDSKNGGLQPSGAVATLAFPDAKSEGEIETIITQIFSCTEPFRLFGIPAKHGSTRYTIRGIDLHTGDKVDFEITSDFIRTYLYPTTCGNVLARLLTNLQHFVDARISFE